MLRKSFVFFINTLNLDRVHWKPDANAYPRPSTHVTFGYHIPQKNVNSFAREKFRYLLNSRFSLFEIVIFMVMNSFIKGILDPFSRNDDGI